MRIKYIAGKMHLRRMSSMGAFDTAITFNNMLTHKDIARRMCMDVESAGFVDFIVEDGKLIIHCFGRSESLDKDSRPEDAKLIAQEMGLSDSEWTSS